MPRLSLAMIVKDEEATLGHCLASVRALVDEIVVVDTGSRDATREVAEAYGAHTSSFPWGDDFAAARNESLRRCGGDWVLVLDADEAIDALDHERIRQTVSAEAGSAFRLILRNYFLDGNQSTAGEAAVVNDTAYAEGSAFRHFADGWGLRLCRRLEGLAFTGRIHELLDPFFESRDLSIGRLDAVVHHYGKTFRDREDRKRNYYLGLAREDVRARPGDPQAWFNLLQQAMCAADWVLALDAADRYLGLQPHAPALVWLGRGMGLQFAGRLEEALRCFDAILAAQPGHAAALARKGVSLGALGRPVEARAALREAIRAQPGFLTPYVNLAELEGGLGQPAAARAALLDALRAVPGDPTILHALVQLSAQRGDLAQAAQDAWMAIQRCPRGGGGTWHRLVAYSLWQGGNATQARTVLELGLDAFPEDAELLRLATTFAARDGGR